MFFSNSFYISSHIAPIDCFFWTSFRFFFLRLSYLLTQFLSILTLEFSAIYLANLFQRAFPNFWLFLVLFRMLWMMVTVNKPCHIPHMSWIITCGTIFMGGHFGVSKEWVRSWSHEFLITYHKTLIKKLFGGTSSKNDEKEKKKKKVAITKLFALKANAISLEEV